MLFICKLNAYKIDLDQGFPSHGGKIAGAKNNKPASLSGFQTDDKPEANAFRKDLTE